MTSQSKKFLDGLAGFLTYGDSVDLDEKLKAEGIDSAQFSAEFKDFFNKTVKIETARRVRLPARPVFKWAFSCAAAALILALCAVKFAAPAVSAESVLLRGAKIVRNLSAIHLKARMRTLPRDNFELIGADYDFVPVEMWKKFSAPPKWRFEKPGRVAVMDGESSVLWIKGGAAFRGGADSGFVLWLKPLLDIDGVLEHERRLAKEQNSELSLRKERGQGGAEKLVVVVEAKAQGVYENDWLKNKSVTESDNRREYLFDAGTGHLEGLRVYVHENGKDELVFEITGIIYNEQLDDSLFRLDLPKDVFSSVLPQAPPEEKYQKMTPEETAEAFFKACGAENWEEAAKFGQVDETVKEVYGGAEIIAIGKPFKSGLYLGVFVPYEIRLRDGSVKKWNLSLRNDNPQKRYVLDGGY